ncbi:bifunctional metallophosphatase/5'-nucleotidase [Lactobacillus psittaci]|uniref:5-nucleotidase n=1 Tax=Lactobacillus psittaci DSM 15354 TaxID=1122152 RepID=A0A0R1S3B0_9LACO|nr:bifunctional UDP-sugar hydrolase/5'-nucleotidase [Lactobacillus psittaci]KRL63552.1 5-nucleotidase [Lactobacillus psittaci DSM 15354]
MKLVFLHTSDTHGFMLPTDYQDKGDYSAPISLSRVSTVIKAKRKEWGNERVIVTDAGDCLQGSPLASYCHAGQDFSRLDSFTACYNEIGYDGRCLGNHDFNFGLDYLKHYIAGNKADFVNDNILDESTEKPAFGQEFKIVEREGVKVGLLGITTQYVPHWEPQEHIKGLKFVSAFDQIKKLAPKLKKQVDLLAVMYHGGFESDLETGEPTEPHTGENEGYKILKEIPEVDIFLTGHQHRRLNTIVDNKPIVQPGYRGECVAEIVMDLDKDGNQVKVKDIKTALIDTADYEPDQAIIDHIKEVDEGTQKWLDQPIANLSEPAPINNAFEGRIKGAPFINLLQQMQIYFTGADISATAVMSEKARGFTSKTVTLRQVILNYPYANQLCKVKLTGKDLKEILEHTATFLEKDAEGNLHFIDRYIKPKPQLYHFDVFYPLHYEVDVSKPHGHRVVKLELNGKPIEDDKIYHLAVNNYRAMGGGFYPAYSMDKIEMMLDKDYVQMFTEYLSSGTVKVDTKPNYKFY